MADFTITTLDTTAETLNNFEFGVIADGGELIVASGDAITGSGENRLLVLGNVTAANFGGLARHAYNFTGTETQVTVGATGTIVSFEGDGLELDATVRVEVINDGMITADNDAVDIDADDASISVDIFNNGLITGNDGIDVNAGAGQVSVTNTGVISATGLAFRSVTTGQTELFNSGTIKSTGTTAIFLGSGNDVVVNTGTMIGNIRLGGGNDLFDGTNGIQGGLENIKLDAGNDTFFGSDRAERIEGDDDEDQIFAGGGNDTILGDSDNDNDTYHGGDGVDLVDYRFSFNPVRVDLQSGLATGGNLGDDQLISIENIRTGSGDDTIVGDDNDNVLRSQEGNDLILGNAGRDRLRGGDDNDTLNGGDGNDRLAGEADDDRLFGGDGNDVLIGGLGRDNMNGDAGNDIFVFLDIADSGTTGGTRDRIADFQQVSDKIDLSGIDANLATTADNPFAFIGNAAFSGTVGELRFRQTATLTLVEADQDGDGSSDFEIRLDGVITLTADDFVL